MSEEPKIINEQGAIEIENAELILYLAGGAAITLEVSPVQLDLFIKGTGTEISLNEDGQGVSINQYSDEDVEKHIIPRIPAAN